MRAFIAIEVPQEIRDRLATLQEELRPTAPSARWVAAESIHVTLKFLGEITDKHREDIDGALTGLTWKPLSVGVQCVGFFPGTSSPRVFWAGLQCSTMEGLAAEINARLEGAGFDSEKRAFRAHLTLARSKEHRLENALVKAAEQYAEIDFGKFTADRFYLYQSTLKAGGSIYTKLKEYSL